MRDWQRNHKTGSRITYQAAYGSALANGFRDVLLTDAEDRILETTTGNLLFAVRGSWITPPLELGVLPGICRGWLIEKGLICEEVLHLRDLPHVTGIAVTNAVVGIAPVCAIGARVFPRAPAEGLRDRAGPRQYCEPARER